jgi:cbb3-type cytochrome oxidase maturation protein
MTGLLFLVPIAVLMGIGALAAFLWSLRSGQYEDLEGASQRILDDGRPANHKSRRGLNS